VNILKKFFIISLFFSIFCELQNSYAQEKDGWCCDFEGNCIERQVIGTLFCCPICPPCGYETAYHHRRQGEKITLDIQYEFGSIKFNDYLKRSPNGKRMIENAREHFRLAKEGKDSGAERSSNALEEGNILNVSWNIVSYSFDAINKINSIFDCYGNISPKKDE